MEQGGKDQLWKCDKCEKQFTTPVMASYIITITLSPASPAAKDTVNYTATPSTALGRPETSVSFSWRHSLATQDPGITCLLEPHAPRIPLTALSPSRPLQDNTPPRQVRVWTFPGVVFTLPCSSLPVQSASPICQSRTTSPVYQSTILPATP